MVSKKRINFRRFDGFHAPVVPKAPRSLRRNSHKKSSSGSEISPFELLAAVAGKLLQESESSTSSTGPEAQQISISKNYVKQEPREVKVKPVRLEFLDHGCCAESEFVPEPSNLDVKLESPLKDLPQSDNDSGLEHASIVTTHVKLEASDSKNGVNGTYSKSEGDLCDVNMDTNRGKPETDAVEKQSVDLNAVKNHDVLRKSYSGVHVPFYSDPAPSACFTRHRSNVKIDVRDDDENSYSYNHHSTKMKAFRWQSRGGYRRIRKFLTSKYWKSAPKLKDYELSNNTSDGVNPIDHNRKKIDKLDRCQNKTAFKRRKLFHHNSKADYVEETSSESISNLPASNTVKLSIKSFKVPELYIEMPETATVGSLKRTVMEAVTAILGGELHVGVLLQGKKVRDDNRTLQQTGISVDSDTLGFTLEPILPQSLVQEEPPLLLPCDNPQPLARSPCPDSPIMDVGFSNSSADLPLSTTSLVNQNQESQPLQVEVSTEEITDDMKAIVPISEVNPESVSMNHKLSKRCEASQRRTRRPFSVSEVEALVEAVETLGTGRWRDVKIRAFEDANHRTYVDLKDKWKTLVHTASISPQQRRGEPVPQHLLDRVLAAHAFWTHHQSKHQSNVVKHQIQPLQTTVKV